MGFFHRGLGFLNVSIIRLRREVTEPVEVPPRCPLNATWYKGMFRWQWKPAGRYFLPGEKAGTKKPELSEEIVHLREITDNFTVPGDVCESFEAVYKMLAELDEAYTGKDS